MPVEILDFNTAVARAHHDGHVHALLGNGFSRACRDDIFSYGALFDRADFEGLARGGIDDGICRRQFEFPRNVSRKQRQGGVERDDCCGLGRGDGGQGGCLVYFAIQPLV